jgi:hypothetical protein
MTLRVTLSIATLSKRILSINRPSIAVNEIEDKDTQHNNI